MIFCSWFQSWPLNIKIISSCLTSKDLPLCNVLNLTVIASEQFPEPNKQAGEEGLSGTTMIYFMMLTHRASAVVSKTGINVWKEMKRRNYKVNKSLRSISIFLSKIRVLLFRFRVSLSRQNYNEYIFRFETRGVSPGSTNVDKDSLRKDTLGIKKHSE